MFGNVYLMYLNRQLSAFVLWLCKSDDLWLIEWKDTFVQIHSQSDLYYQKLHIFQFYQFIPVLQCITLFEQLVTTKEICTLKKYRKIKIVKKT